MIDYLKGLLAENSNGIDVLVFSLESNSFRQEHLVAVDSVGKVTKDKGGALQFTPWHAVHTIRIPTEAA